MCVRACVLIVQVQRVITSYQRGTHLHYTAMCTDRDCSCATSTVRMYLCMLTEVAYKQNNFVSGQSGYNYTLVYISTTTQVHCTLAQSHARSCLFGCYKLHSLQLD